MKRVLCIWLPDWPLQRLLAVRPELEHRSVVLHARDPRRGELVVICSPTAHQHGVRAGMPLVEAAALAGSHDGPAAIFQPHDAGVDRLVLQELAKWCDQFSPLVGLELADPPSALLLNVTGLSPLFGGEIQLARRVARLFRQRGYTVHVAIADTIAAAWALARFAVCRSPFLVSPPGASFPLLKSLPLEALRLPTKTIELLCGLGIDRIEQLMQLPRDSLSSRFGNVLVQRLGQAEGTIKEVIVAYRPAPQFQASWSLEHPTDCGDVIQSVMEGLVERIAGRLAERDQGAVQLECRLRVTPELGKVSTHSHVDPKPDDFGHASVAGNFDSQRVVRIRVGLFQPSARASHLWQLVRMQLERLRLPGPVASIVVQAVTTASLESRQYELFGNGVYQAERQLAALIDRLSSRLGRESVLAARWRADAQPEHACRYVSLAGNGPPRKQRRTNSKRKQKRSNRRGGFTGPQQNAPLPTGGKAGTRCGGQPDLLPAARPLRLYCPPLPLRVISIAPDGQPVRFAYRGGRHHIVWHWGPERIETAWWRGPSVQRDYYRVETSTGYRFWLFRCLTDGKWFLQGAFV